ncbi:MAG: choice-of-anchor U domain-containing protein [Pirellulales bacterium]
MASDVRRGTGGVKFLPAANSNVAGHFDVESSQNGTTVAAQSGKAISTIGVTPVGDTPQVANVTTLEDTLSAAIVLSRHASDGAEVTHFRVSNITGGMLFKSDGTTPIASGDFLSYAEGQSGVKFLPAANSNVAGHFDVESSQNGTTVAAQSGKATSTIGVTPVGDTPQVANVTTLEDTLSAAIIIARSAVDGSEVTHFKISGIVDGELFQHDGITPILDPQFISIAEGLAGVRFRPAAGFVGTAQFLVQASIAADDVGLGDAAVPVLVEVSNGPSPSAVIVPITPDPRNTAVGVVTISFSEPVTGVGSDDFQLTRNGSSVSLSGVVVAGDGLTRTIDLTSVSATSGDYVLTLLAAGVVDLVGNPLVADVSDSWVSDFETPSVVITPDGGLSGSDAVEFTFQFSEPVDDFTLDRIGLTNATAVAFTIVSADRYVVTVAPASDGAVAVELPADAVRDGAGNGNSPGSATIISDRTGPEFTSSASAAVAENSTVAATLSANDAHGPPVFAISQGADADRFQLTPAGELTFVSAPDFEMPADADGDNVYDVLVAAMDTLGNTTIQAVSVTVTDRDDSEPIALAFERLNPLASSTDADIVVYRVTFSEPVFQVDAADFVATGTTALIFLTSINATQFGVQISGGNLAELNGVVNLDLAPSPTIEDAAGNLVVQAEPAVDETYTLVNAPWEVDGDGVPDAVEDLAPHQGDGNADGIPDRNQPDVASLQDAQGQVVTLATSDGLPLQDVHFAPPPATGPSGASFPLGVLDFKVPVPNQGDEVTVTLIVHGGPYFNTFYRYGREPARPTPHWHRFVFDGRTGAEIFADRIVLHLRDGERGDDDLTANGMILDPSGPAVDERLHPHQNPESMYNVNDDGQVTPIDVLLVINELNERGGHRLPVPLPLPISRLLYLDVNGDDQVTPLDALLVIGELNTRGAHPVNLVADRAEGELGVGVIRGEAVSSFGPQVEGNVRPRPARRGVPPLLLSPVCVVVGPPCGWSIVMGNLGLGAKELEFRPTGLG